MVLFGMVAIVVIFVVVIIATASIVMASLVYPLPLLSLLPLARESEHIRAIGSIAVVIHTLRQPCCDICVAMLLQIVHSHHVVAQWLAAAAAAQHRRGRNSSQLFWCYKK